MRIARSDDHFTNVFSRMTDCQCNFYFVEVGNNMLICENQRYLSLSSRSVKLTEVEEPSSY